MALLGRLGVAETLEAHLVPRRREQLIGGAQRTFAADTLRPGDEVICLIGGRRLESGVPIETELKRETGYGGAGITTIELAVTRHTDGSVTARCA